MFAYPPKAEFNRVLPKSKIYAHAQAGRKVKELFVAQVGEITWKYKLSPETINLPGRHGINEIQVFEIALKNERFDESILNIIDKAIPYPILFQLTHGTRIRFAASYKRPNEADPSKWVIEGNFLSPWQDIAKERPLLQVALDLAGLYDHLVRAHMTLPPRNGESLREHVARFITIRAKEKECQQLESRLSKEKQFNRKVELNAVLRTLRQEIEFLHT